MTPCYGEEANVRDVYQRARAVRATLPAYRYEHLFIDNCSSDHTVATLLSDLRDPPELLAEMVARWEQGLPMVLGIRRTSQESGLMFRIGTAYHRLVPRLVDIKVYEHFTGI